jgi:toxin ParE1/3/4
MLSPATNKFADIKRCSSILIVTPSQRTPQTTFLPPPGRESPHAAMAKYRLTDRARADLIDIFDFTEEKFGVYQAEAYYAGLIRTFELLADFPRIGQPFDELAAGYRRFRFQSHLIFYTERSDHVEIRAIVHGSQNPRPQLFD